MIHSASYLGAFYYNESPEQLGGEGGFRQLESYEALEQAYESSRYLNRQFNEMGVMTESHIIWAVDHQAYTLFHLLVVSVKPHLWLRQFELLEMVLAWLKTQGHAELDITHIGIAGVSRKRHARLKQQAEADWKNLQAELQHQALEEDRRAEALRRERVTWEADVDARIAQTPYRKREILDRLCHHFALPVVNWLPIPPGWDELAATVPEGVDLDTLTDKVYWETYGDPIHKQFYEAFDRIIPPLWQRFALPEPDEDWFTVEMMQDIYTAIMTAAGFPAHDLSWIEN